MHTQMQGGIRSEYQARKSWMREVDLRPKPNRLNPVHGAIQSTLLHSKRKDLANAPDALDPLAMPRAQRRQGQPKVFICACFRGAGDLPGPEHRAGAAARTYSGAPPSTST